MFHAACRRSTKALERTVAHLIDENARLARMLETKDARLNAMHGLGFEAHEHMKTLAHERELAEHTLELERLGFEREAKNDQPPRPVPPTEDEAPIDPLEEEVLVEVEEDDVPASESVHVHPPEAAGNGRAS